MITSIADVINLRLQEFLSGICIDTAEIIPPGIIIQSFVKAKTSFFHNNAGENVSIEFFLNCRKEAINAIEDRKVHGRE